MLRDVINCEIYKYIKQDYITKKNKKVSENKMNQSSEK